MADVLATTIALFVVLNLLGDDRPAPAALLVTPLVVVLFKVAGLYLRDEVRLVHSTLDEAPLLLQLTGLFALCVTILEPILLEGTLGPAQIAGLWLGAFAAVLSGRMLARSLAGHISPSERCLLIGDRGLADRVSERLRSSRARAVVVASLPLENGSMDLLSDREGFRNAVSELGVHRIIIAPATTDTSDVTLLIRVAKSVGVRVSVVPRMFEAVGSAVEFDDVDGMTMLGVRRFGLVRSSRLLKRSFDLIVGSLALLLLARLQLRAQQDVTLAAIAVQQLDACRVGDVVEHASNDLPHRCNAGAHRQHEQAALLSDGILPLAVRTVDVQRAAERQRVQVHRHDAVQWI